MSWQDKKVAILGFGREGQAMAEYLLQEGAEITICDEREASALGEIYERWQSRTVHWQLGPSYLKNLEKFSAIVRSPGVPLNLPAIARARAEGSDITSQTKLFFSLCPASVIGVTGTKGKGTTSTLIQKMLEAGRKKVWLVGNIGVPAINILPKLKQKYWVVYELSSFQLQDLTQSPHIAVILGLTVDHQDYHKTPEEYFAAKTNILKWQTKQDDAIFNIDYPETRRLEKLTKGAVYHTSREVPVKDGAYVAGDVIFRRMYGKTERVCYVHEVALKGRHNLENICAAVIAATLAGVSLSVIKKVLKSFKGLPHRLEFIGERHGIEYWNDSYATTPETTIAAIRSFTEPIVLLLGGSEKGLDYERLAEGIVESSVKTIVGIGLSAKKMYDNIVKAAKAKNKKPPPLVEGGRAMTEMIKAARRHAKPGDIILLSPAAASFDHFTNATERGEEFKKEVKAA